MKPSIPLKNPMIPESYKPDISNLVRSGHFYFGLTGRISFVDFEKPICYKIHSDIRESQCVGFKRDSSIAVPWLDWVHHLIPSN